MERIEFRVGDIVLVADALGPSEGQPVLFLHGGGQTRQSWGNAVNEAAARGFRAYAIDLRGHGESGWSPDGRYGLNRFAEDVRVVTTQTDQAPVLVGASLGGIASLLVAASPPPEIAALVLVDIAVRVDTDGAQEIERFMASAPGGFASLEEAVAAVAAYLPHRPRPKDTSGLMRNLRARADGRLYWHWDPAFLDQPAEAFIDTDALDAAARALKVPTLLVRGARSRVLTAQGAQHFLELAPHASFVDVAGADHMVAGDANDAFNTAIFTFLAALPTLEIAR